MQNSGQINTECKIGDILIFKSKIRISYNNTFKIEVERDMSAK